MLSSMLVCLPLNNKSIINVQFCRSVLDEKGIPNEHRMNTEYFIAQLAEYTGTWRGNQRLQTVSFFPL